MTNSKYRKHATSLIAVWFIFSLAASALHVFRTDPSRPPLPLGLAVLTPIVPVFILVCRIGTISGIRASFEPAHIDCRAGMEDCWFCVPRVVYVRHSPWYVRIACWVGRYRHRSDCPVRGNELC